MTQDDIKKLIASLKFGDQNTNDISAFFEMLADSDYQASLVHREAGLEATVIMVTRPNFQIPLGLKP